MNLAPHVAAPRARPVSPPDPRLAEALRIAVAVGAVLVLLWPGARGHSAALGWLPLWLLGMPLASWWALHRFALPARLATGSAGPARRRRPPPQVRRRTRSVLPRGRRVA